MDNTMLSVVSDITPFPNYNETTGNADVVEESLLSLLILLII